MMASGYFLNVKEGICMSWVEDFLIAAASIADTETISMNKRKQVVDKNLKKVQKGSFLKKPDKSLNKEIKKLNSDYNRAARKGSIKKMNKTVSELERISETQKQQRSNKK